MTEELERALAAAKTLAEVEDLYRPYKPKRKTRASVAKARGLEPLAQALLAQDARLDVQAEAEKYITEEVPDAEAALAGARDILAEQVSDDAALRAELRKFYRAFGLVKSKAAKEEDSVYAQYYDFSEPVNRIAGHRVLALDRGEREEFLKVSVEVDPERACGIARRMFVKKSGGASAAQVDEAVQDVYKRQSHRGASAPAWGRASQEKAGETAYSACSCSTVYPEAAGLSRYAASFASKRMALSLIHIFSLLCGQSSGALRAMNEFFKTSGMKRLGAVTFPNAKGGAELPLRITKKIGRLLK